jgi:orotidine-5'-phosphate decarboxylase
MTEGGKRIMVALDFDSLEKASSMARLLKGKVGGFKVGHELNMVAGPPALIKEFGSDILLDLKIKDKPKTVAATVKAAARQQVKMLTLMCDGGRTMLEAAREAAEDVHAQTGHKLLLIGVTVLSSLTDKEVYETGIDKELGIDDLVEELTMLAIETNLDGIVCSPQELPLAKEMTEFKKMLVITPGIRRLGDKMSGQKRTHRPADAIRRGADILVIGEPITRAAFPLYVVEEIVAEIDKTLA